MSAIGDIRKTASRALEALRRRASIAHSYRSAFSGGTGEAVLHDLLREAGVLSVSHVEGDSHATAFNDGKRAMGLHICERLRWSEMQLLKLAEQQTQDRLTEADDGE
jgi:hypothetical protein